MKAKFNCAVVKAIATTVPASALDLREASELGTPQELARIIAGTGIRKIRVASTGMTTSDLCLEAGNRVLDQLSVTRESIDAVVFVSQTPDHLLPATSATLQHRLGLKKDCLAFDLNFGCSGYIYGLLQAHLLVNAGLASRVLVFAGDTITQHLKREDRAVRTVLGDAGSATLVEKGESQSHFILKTDGSGAPALMVRPGETLHMDGMAVMNFALREVPAIVEETLRDRGWSKDQVGLFALHQANRFMVEYLRRVLRVPADSAPFLLEEYGNSGPATIPALLCLGADAFRKSGKLGSVVLCGFGSGLSWGTLATSLEHTHFLPVGEMHAR